MPGGAIGDPAFREVFGRELDALAEARDEAAVLAACSATAADLADRGVSLADALLAADALGETVEGLHGEVAQLRTGLRAVFPLRARAYAGVYLARDRTPRPAEAIGRCVGGVSHLRLADDDGLVGRSAAIEALRSAIAEAARRPCAEGILVTGEAGTGKELVARAVHAAAGGRGPFLAVRCATLPRHLADAELFGRARGATGLVAAADGGTLFLQEVTELGMDVQAKLAHLLDAGAARPAVRVVASTRRDPEQAVAEGRLRDDLLRRLRAVTLAVPPLRDRRDDVPLLVEHFLGSFCARRSGCVAGVSPTALAALAAADWPENVRELRRAVEEAVAVGADVTIGLEDLPPRLRAGHGGDARSTVPPDPAPLPTLAEAEAHLIRLALAHHRGNKVAAARALGISRHKLYDKLRQLGES